MILPHRTSGPCFFNRLLALRVALALKTLQATDDIDGEAFLARGGADATSLVQQLSQLARRSGSGRPLRRKWNGAANSSLSLVKRVNRSNSCVPESTEILEGIRMYQALASLAAKQEVDAMLERDRDEDSSDGFDTKALAETAMCRSEERMLFLHIPKNAGTTVEEVALASNVTWGKHMNFEHCKLGRRACHADWHTPPAYFKGNTMYSGKPVFCVVRNPYERAISEYKYIVNDTRFRFEYEDTIKENGCTRTGLNAFLRSVLKSYQDGEKYKQLCHMLPQSEYIWGAFGRGGRHHHCQWCTEILHVEEFPHSFNSLMTNYGYPMRLEEKTQEKVNTGVCANLTIGDLGPDVRELIQEVYSEDFRMLNYTM